MHTFTPPLSAPRVYHWSAVAPSVLLCETESAEEHLCVQVDG